MGAQPGVWWERGVGYEGVLCDGHGLEAILLGEGVTGEEAEGGSEVGGAARGCAGPVNEDERERRRGLGPQPRCDGLHGGSIAVLLVLC